eukprot:GCRY01002822.1.p1 GENE.GCRY01002822.1~~GCRY01002822.1.p1  ORF type:complete len:697 (-),score=186.23 GCRY01002822.1:118-2208(-)
MFHNNVNMKMYRRKRANSFTPLIELQKQKQKKERIWHLKLLLGFILPCFFICVLLQIGPFSLPSLTLDGKVNFLQRTLSATTNSTDSKPGNVVKYHSGVDFRAEATDDQRFPLNNIGHYYYMLIMKALPGVIAASVFLLIGVVYIVYKLLFVLFCGCVCLRKKEHKKYSPRSISAIQGIVAAFTLGVYVVVSVGFNANDGLSEGVGDFSGFIVSGATDVQSILNTTMNGMIKYRPQFIEYAQVSESDFDRVVSTLADTGQNIVSTAQDVSDRIDRYDRLRELAIVLLYALAMGVVALGFAGALLSFKFLALLSALCCFLPTALMFIGYGAHLSATVITADVCWAISDIINGREEETVLDMIYECPDIDLDLVKWTEDAMAYLESALDTGGSSLPAEQRAEIEEVYSDLSRVLAELLRLADCEPIRQAFFNMKYTLCTDILDELVYLFQSELALGIIIGLSFFFLVFGRGRLGQGKVFMGLFAGKAPKREEDDIEWVKADYPRPADIAVGEETALYTYNITYDQSTLPSSDTRGFGETTYCADELDLVGGAEATANDGVHGVETSADTDLLSDFDASLAAVDDGGCDAPGAGAGAGETVLREDPSSFSARPQDGYALLAESETALLVDDEEEDEEEDWRERDSEIGPRIRPWPEDAPPSAPPPPDRQQGFDYADHLSSFDSGLSLGDDEEAEGGSLD